MPPVMQKRTPTVTPSARWAIVVDRKVLQDRPVRRVHPARLALWVQPVRPDRLALRVNLADLRDRPALPERRALLALRALLVRPDRRVQLVLKV